MHYKLLSSEIFAPHLVVGEIMSRVPCTNTSCRDGLIAHVKRQIDGKPDPWDLQENETCPVCGGAGSLPYVRPRIVAEPQAPAAAMNFTGMYDMGNCRECRG